MQALRPRASEPSARAEQRREETVDSRDPLLCPYHVVVCTEDTTGPLYNTTESIEANPDTDPRLVPMVVALPQRTGKAAYVPN